VSFMNFSFSHSKLDNSLVIFSILDSNVSTFSFCDFSFTLRESILFFVSTISFNRATLLVSLLVRSESSLVYFSDSSVKSFSFDSSNHFKYSKLDFEVSFSNSKACMSPSRRDMMFFVCSDFSINNFCSLSYLF